MLMQIKTLMETAPEFGLQAAGAHAGPRPDGGDGGDLHRGRAARILQEAALDAAVGRLRLRAQRLPGPKRRRTPKRPSLPRRRGEV